MSDEEKTAVSFDLLQISPSDTWKLRHEVLWPDKPLSYVKLEEDEQGFHYGVRVKENLVSVISLFVKGQEAQFRKFATQSNEQGKGYGSQLLAHTLKEATKLGVTRIWCNARVETAGFYKRFDMVETDTQFYKGKIPYVIMEKRLDEQVNEERDG